ncbi:MAG: eL32 family ribosomal protein [Nanoarchaeota archaeon]
MRKFVRQDTTRYSRIGRGRKKLQKWRKPRGRHNKIRRKRFSYPVQPSLGFRKMKNVRGKILGLNPVLVYNVNDLQSVGKDSIVVIAKIGAKKKIDVLKKALELKLKVLEPRVRRQKDAT